MKKNYGCILAALILLTACGQKKEDSVTTVRPVKTARVESRSEIRKDFSGIVEAVDYVKLAFRVSGQIINLPVVEGQRVKKGQLIAAIDPRDLALQYAADNRLTKPPPHKWSVTNDCWHGKPSRYRNMKSAYRPSNKKSRPTNFQAIICGTPD